MTEVNKDAIQMWVDALRKGGYEQGKGFLRTEDDKYCCLGVACDIYPDRVWDKPVLHEYGYENKPAYEMGSQYNILPSDVAEWLGFDNDQSPAAHFFDPVTGENTRVALYAMNDVWGLPFDVIASLLEKEYLND